MTFLFSQFAQTTTFTLPPLVLTSNLPTALAYCIMFRTRRSTIRAESKRQHTCPPPPHNTYNARAMLFAACTIKRTRSAPSHLILITFLLDQGVHQSLGVSPLDIYYSLPHSLSLVSGVNRVWGRFGTHVRNFELRSSSEKGFATMISLFNF